MEKDIIVIGGGPAGMASAWGCAKQGAKVLLIERYGFLGGMATAGFVGSILGHYLNEKEPAVSGFLKFLIEKTYQMDGCEKWESAFRKYGISFDSEILKISSEKLLLEEKVEILYHSFVSSVKIEDSLIKEIEVVNKSGKMKIKGKVFIDATGDADIAFYSGFNYTKGRFFDGKMQSMGCMFKIAGIDEEKITEEVAKKAGNLLNELKEKGELIIYNTGLGGKGSTTRKGERSFNVMRFQGDGTDVFDLTKGEIFIRDQIYKYWKFLKENVPGFESSYISALPPNIGIRETRQIEGLYTLTEDDILKGRKFDSSIARGTYWIDIHCPLGRTKKVHLCVKECQTEEYCIALDKFKDYLPAKNKLYPPKNDWFSIPYECLIPKNSKNLLVTGRCISADHKAMSSIRVMATCIATGHSAGIGAYIALDKNISVDKVNPLEVQKILEKQEGLY
ncbi:MAG TPA: FAD-dependent oxidoreductase [bacterium]|nr:FAD-dependent oxidoreductase [bacterium]HOM26047.1 FAD-dependent oxidoreductase [bacterium]